MIQNFLNVIVWLTPLMYFPQQLGSKRYLADYNPFTHIHRVAAGAAFGWHADIE